MSDKQQCQYGCGQGCIGEGAAVCHLFVDGLDYPEYTAETGNPHYFWAGPICTRCLENVKAWARASESATLEVQPLKEQEETGLPGLGHGWYTFTVSIRGLGATAAEAYEHALEGFCQDPGPTPEHYEFEFEPEENEDARLPSGTQAG